MLNQNKSALDRRVNSVYRSSKRAIALLAGTIGISVGLAGATQAALINSYDFTGGLSDTLGNGNDLTASGGTVSGGRYNFGLNQGLRLTNALPSTTAYAIELGLQVNDSLAGFNKLIDFQDLSDANKASDSGLYIRDSAITFFNAEAPVSAGTLSLNTDFTVGMERAATGVLRLFLNGSLIRTGTDSENSGISGFNQAVSANNILNFFEDELWGGNQNEAFVGSADFIRIHNDATSFGQEPAVSAVPLPAAFPLLAGGLGLLGLTGWRRRRKAATAAV